MAKDHSFDIVSVVDPQEVDNAVQQAMREVRQRYDLKDSGARLDFDRNQSSVTLTAPDDFTARQVIDLLGTKLARRGVDLKAVKWGDPESAAGGTVRRVATIVNGIDADTCRAINKDIKAEKFKVKVQIEGDKVRVFGPKKDVLQEVITFVKGRDYGIPLQFTNYR
ncbi:MAG: YajQ family cyclic di-GMP-binding protein [Coriobacteriia bacterium]